MLVSENRFKLKNLCVLLPELPLHTHRSCFLWTNFTEFYEFKWPGICQRQLRNPYPGRALFHKGRGKTADRQENGWTRKRRKRMPWIHATVLCLSSANHTWVRVYEPYSDWLIPLWYVSIQRRYTPGQDVRETFSACCDLSLPEKRKQTTVVVGSLSVLLCSTTWYIPGLLQHLIFIILATVDIKNIHSLWLLVQSLTAG